MLQKNVTDTGISKLFDHNALSLIFDTFTCLVRQSSQYLQQSGALTFFLDFILFNLSELHCKCLHDGSVEHIFDNQFQSHLLTILSHVSKPTSIVMFGFVLMMARRCVTPLISCIIFIGDCKMSSGRYLSNDMIMRFGVSFLYLLSICLSLF